MRVLVEREGDFEMLYAGCIYSDAEGSFKRRNSTGYIQGMSQYEESEHHQTETDYERGQVISPSGRKTP